MQCDVLNSAFAEGLLRSQGEKKGEKKGME